MSQIATMPKPENLSDDLIMSASKTHVILIDDHAVVREGVRALLEDQIEFQVIGEYGDGQSALDANILIAPDVAILDLKMPGIGPVEIIRGLRARWPQIQIMVFTSFGENEQIQATLDAGAIGFMLKDALGFDLLSAVRSVARGEPWLHPSAQRQLMSMLRSRPAQTDSLTGREMDVMRGIARGQSNKDIARNLGISEGTVKGYVSQILEKLRLNDRTQVALYASKNGFGG